MLLVRLWHLQANTRQSGEQTNCCGDQWERKLPLVWSWWVSDTGCGPRRADMNQMWESRLRPRIWIAVTSRFFFFFLCTSHLTYSISSLIGVWLTSSERYTCSTTDLSLWWSAWEVEGWVRIYWNHKRFPTFSKNTAGFCKLKLFRL